LAAFSGDADVMHSAASDRLRKGRIATVELFEKIRREDEHETRIEKDVARKLVVTGIDSKMIKAQIVVQNIVQLAANKPISPTFQHRSRLQNQ